ncbi:MAG: redox-regulated ATPase YchF [Flavobacteriaceae bacterium]|nr:redox-regulated ATPase YchF [Flavobacteriaceae bacterium]
MKAGIIGLPNVGKSTLFNSLSTSKAQSANFPFCTIEPNIGLVNVPDKRLEVLESLVNPEKVQPASVEIVDIAGLVKGASKGEGLGNQFLANIRETDAIIHVIRCFENDNITHVEGSINPIRDKEIIDIELQLKDLESVDKRMEKLNKLLRAGDKEVKIFHKILTKLKSSLEKSINIRELDFSEEEYVKFINPLNLLTNKPVLYVCNVDEKDAVNGNIFVEKIQELVENEKSEILLLAVASEAEINELEDYNDRKLFLNEIGLSESGSSKLLKTTYKLLNFHTFFTAGEKEVKAWTIPIGISAQKAAGVIHSDFENGFIKAEVIPFEMFIKYGSNLKVKEAGKMRVEGRDYLVNDGDIIYFRFNV